MEGRAAVDLASFIRDVPDFPKPGIVFKDITPLLGDCSAFAEAVERMADPFRDAGVTRVAAPESRGFIFGAAIARSLDAGFVPIRKPGKLPWETRRHDYALEYGSDSVEIHGDAVTSEDRVLLVDDVLATGGTAAASISLIQALGGIVVGTSFLIELTFLPGRTRIEPHAVMSILKM